MTYPAFSSFFADPERTTARICVYMALQPPFLSHATPRDVKLEVVSRASRLSKSATSRALAWLAERGYIVIHSRDQRGMPSITLAYALDAPEFRAATVHPLRVTNGGHTPNQ